MIVLKHVRLYSVQNSPIAAVSFKMKSTSVTLPNKFLLDGSLASFLSSSPAAPLILTLLSSHFLLLVAQTLEALFQAAHLPSLFARQGCPSFRSPPASSFLSLTSFLKCQFLAADIPVSLFQLSFPALSLPTPDLTLFNLQSLDVCLLSANSPPLTPLECKSVGVGVLLWLLYLQSLQ